jgi:ankyrin repeat protein
MVKRIVFGIAALVAAVALAAMFSFNGRDAVAEETFSDPQALALANAMMAGDETEMALLVAGGVDPNASGKDGMTLLEWEIWREGLRGVRALVRLGADPSRIGGNGNTPMHIAAMYQNDLYLKELVSLGGDVNAVDGRMKSTPIYTALRANRQDNVDFLLANGGRLDVADRSGDTPLHVAALINDFDNVLRFLELGADPLAVDARGDTFQQAIFWTDPDLLNVNATAKRNQIIAFLKARDLPLDPKAER